MKFLEITSYPLTFFFCLCRARLAALALLTGLGSELLMKSSNSSTSLLSMALAAVRSESWRCGGSSLRPGQARAELLPDLGVVTACWCRWRLLRKMWI